ncbi:MAG TPA: tetratricopeptide repeat protein [Longimicrobium sp.]|jgi:tetratricopeptide (TPR) repeat protein
MKSRWSWAVGALVASVIAITAVGAAVSGDAEPALAGTLEPVAELARRDADIAFFRARAAEDPWGAADRSRLAQLYLQRGREGGGLDDFRRAERAAREALTLRAGRNTGARLTLASSLLAQHRFAEARTAAEALVAEAPDRASYQALLGEIQMELGDYGAAAATFGALEAERGNLAVAPRLARWEEVRGNPVRARAILYAARDQAAARIDLPREQVAWFHLRVADLELRTGRLGAADEALRAGLAVEPNDPRLWAARARLAALRHRWREVARIGARLGDGADLATLALVGDAWAQLGRAGEAERWYARLEAKNAARPEPFARQWTQFRVDHGRHLPETLALLRREAGERRDVLGCDLLAWALHRAGDDAAAREAMRQALRMGTRDATLHFHAGMIERALGDRAAARAHLRRALGLNPRFHPTFPDTARAALRELEHSAPRPLSGRLSVGAAAEALLVTGGRPPAGVRGRRRRAAGGIVDGGRDTRGKSSYHPGERPQALDGGRPAGGTGP